jgi:hypothetical protein
LKGTIHINSLEHNQFSLVLFFRILYTVIIYLIDKY